jgi:hypothetical protein
MFFSKVVDEMKRALTFLFVLSDSISTSAFHRFRSDWVLEIGVHKGELPRHINGLTPYIGFEANPANIDLYNLGVLNVHNYAVVPSDFKDQFVRFEIPVRDAKSDQMNSGKGSILKRNPRGWGKSIQLEVPAVRVDEIAHLFKMPLDSKAGKIWVDAEGISVTLVREMLSSYNVSSCHFEYDFKLGQYTETLDRDLSFLSGKRFFKARSSHDQYNVVVFDRYDWLLIRDMFVLKVIDITIDCIFILNRIRKRR